MALVITSVYDVPETEESTVASQKTNQSRFVSSGKENVQDAGKYKLTKNKNGKVDSKIELINTEYSPDIDSYSGTKEKLPSHNSTRDEESDETDAEDELVICDVNATSITSAKIASRDISRRVIPDQHKKRRLSSIESSEDEDQPQLNSSRKVNDIQDKISPGNSPADTGPVFMDDKNAVRVLLTTFPPIL